MQAQQTTVMAGNPSTGGTKVGDFGFRVDYSEEVGHSFGRVTWSVNVDYCVRAVGAGGDQEELLYPRPSLASQAEGVSTKLK